MYFRTGETVVKQCGGTSTSMTYGMIAQWLACWANDRDIGVPVLLAAGSRVATVGQLLFAPWAWVYSTLHPFMVGKWVPATAGKVGMFDAAWCAPCTWAPLRWAMPTKGCYNKCLTFTFDLYLIYGHCSMLVEALLLLAGSGRCWPCRTWWRENRTVVTSSVKNQWWVGGICILQPDGWTSSCSKPTTDTLLPSLCDVISLPPAAYCLQLDIMDR